MKTIDKISKIVFYACAIIILGLLLIPRPIKAEEQRDLQYEAYCDSIWENNPEYYQDTLVETDKYQNYIDEHGIWWEEDCPAYSDIKSEYNELKKANDFKRELIDAQEKCLNEAEFIMLRNGLYNECYAKLKFRLDSLYSTQL